MDEMEKSIREEFDRVNRSIHNHPPAVDLYAPKNPDENYASLWRILRLAFEQSAFGKGKERHANSLRWDDQPILQITRSKGLGFPAGQADKKITEALGMVEREEYDRALHELLGAIIYTAALYRRIEELREGDI